MTILINLLFCVVYMLCGLVLEELGFTSPALFSFYGFMMCLICILINKHIHNDIF